MRELDELFSALATSPFRSRFRLTPSDCAYVARKSPATIRRHAADIISRRLAPAHPENDGRQTPMRGHPVFVAQHATATCCRSCLAKWHGIPPGHALSEREIDYVVRVIEHWIAGQTGDSPLQHDPQRRLFDSEP